MSVETALVIPESAVDVVTDAFFAEALAGSLEELRKGDLEIMHEYNPPLFAFHRKRFVEIAGKGAVDEANRFSAGYLLGHRVLRSAVASDQPLPDVGSIEIERYALRLSQKPALLDEDIQRDYAHTKAIVSVLNERLRFPGNKTGAGIILGAYGKWANPERSEITLPSLPVHTSQPQPGGIKTSRRKAVYASANRFGLK